MSIAFQFASRLTRSSAMGCVAFSATGLFSAGALASQWVFTPATFWLGLYFSLALLGALGCSWFRAWRWAAAGAVCALVSGALLAPLYFPRPTKGVEPNLRILTANLYISNEDPARLLALVEALDPDVLAFQEVDEDWVEFLTPLHEHYAHHAIVPRGPGGGSKLGLFWREGDEAAQVLADQNLPAAVLALRVNGRTVHFVNVHTAAPWSPRRARNHEAQMRGLAEYLQTLEGPVIAAGDFNCGLWSPLYRGLVADTGLTNARMGFGLLGTWPSFAASVGAPLDHVLVSPGLSVMGCWAGPGFGSDHRPLIVDIHIE